MKSRLCFVVGAAVTGVNAFADVPRPTGSSLIPLQHSPQWQWLAAMLERNNPTPYAHQQRIQTQVGVALSVVRSRRSP